MRARNREVNIFNMSLLDILCGALGAFCFMMLVLFPYWRPEGQSAEEANKSAEELERQISELQQKLKGSAQAEEAIRRLQQMRTQVQQMQGMLNQARSAAEQAQRQAQEMQKRAQQAEQDVQDLNSRTHVLVAMHWRTPSHDVDLYVRSDGSTSEGKKPPEPDISQKQSPFFGTDQYYDCKKGPCSESWVTGGTPPGRKLQVCYKLMSDNGNSEPAQVSGVLTSERGFDRLPSVSLTKAAPMACIGNVLVKGGQKLEFQPAPEYAAAYQQVKVPEQTTPQQSPASK